MNEHIWAHWMVRFNIYEFEMYKFDSNTKTFTKGGVTLVILIIISFMAWYYRHFDSLMFTAPQLTMYWFIGLIISLFTSISLTSKFLHRL